MQELCRTIAPLTYLAIIFPSKLGFDLVALDYGQLTQNISWTNGIFCIYWNSEFHSRRESIKEGNFSYHPLGGVISPIFGEHPLGPSFDTSTRLVFALMSIMHYSAIKVDEIRHEKCVCQPGRGMFYCMKYALNLICKYWFFESKSISE